MAYTPEAGHVVRVIAEKWRKTGFDVGKVLLVKAEWVNGVGGATYDNWCVEVERLAPDEEAAWRLTNDG